MVHQNPFNYFNTEQKSLAAQIEKNGVEFVKQKLNLTTLWPVLLDEDEWDESLWNATDFYRFSVDFFIDTDLKNTSKRALYVSFSFGDSLEYLVVINHVN